MVRKNSKYVCDVCGNAYDSQPALNSHKGQIHDTSVTLECEWCGDDFSVTPHEAEVRTGCSVECGRKIQGSKMTGENNPQYSENVELECEVCGTAFEVNPSQTDSRRTCSKDCLADVQADEFAGKGNPVYNESFDTEWAVELYQSGETTTSIAEKCDVSDWTICKRLHEHPDVTVEKSGWAEKNIATARGEMVRSYYEKRVANYLHLHSVAYEYEPKGFGRYVPDFVVDGVVIEVWGVEGNDEYDEKRKEKEQWYAANQIKCVGVEPNDLDNLRERLSMFL